MCILGKLLGVETYWFGNWRAERGDVLVYGSVRYIRECFGVKVGKIFIGGRKRC